MNEPADWDRPHLSGGALRMTNDLLKYNSNKQTTFFEEKKKMKKKHTHTGDAYHLGACRERAAMGSSDSVSIPTPTICYPLKLFWNFLFFFIGKRLCRVLNAPGSSTENFLFKNYFFSRFSAF